MEYVGGSQFMGKEHGKTSEFNLDNTKQQFCADLKAVASDLDSNGLAERYTDSLFNHLVQTGAKTERELVEAGKEVFYNVGREVLGPLAVQFVDKILKEAPGGRVIFLARDGTPLYHIARTLLEEKPEDYPITTQDIMHTTLHREHWEVTDEKNAAGQNGEVTKQKVLIDKLLQQMGLGSDMHISFVDVGAWGTMADYFKKKFPDQNFSLYFLYTHLPNHIYGHTNVHAQDNMRMPIPESVLETLADTWEAFPKAIVKQTLLEEVDGVVVPKQEGTEVNSPYLKAWNVAAIQGLEDAARDLIAGKQIQPYSEIQRLWDLSEKAKKGFTGILPEHTDTWPKGAEWRANWPWGKIPPLK